MAPVWKSHQLDTVPCAARVLGEQQRHRKQARAVAQAVEQQAAMDGDAFFKIGSSNFFYTTVDTCSSWQPFSALLRHRVPPRHPLHFPNGCPPGTCKLDRRRFRHSRSARTRTGLILALGIFAATRVDRADVRGTEPRLSLSFLTRSLLVSPHLTVCGKQALKHGVHAVQPNGVHERLARCQVRYR
jgi:hypothetical protein